MEEQRGRDAGHFDAALRAARDGEEWGFRHLFETFRGPLWAFVAARGCLDPDAVVNVVMFKVFRSLNQFEGAEIAFRAYLFRTARNQLIDDHRKRLRQVDVIDQDLTDTVGVRHIAPDTADDVIARMSADVVRGVFQELTPDQRDVLTLRIIGDLSVVQTAEVLGKPVSAVKALQHRALAALRRKIEAGVVTL